MPSEKPFANNPVGRTIGSYLVESQVGAGGMGEVYQARDTRLDRLVAIKLLPMAVTSDPERFRRFHVEARAASSLNHPHILVVHDIGEIDGRPFIVTELVAGETLRQKMEAGRSPFVRRSISARRWRARSRPLTGAASCTATSSPRTSWSGPTAT